MADINTKNALTNVTNDIKTRPVFDAMSADMSGSQFMDVMMARTVSPSAGDDEQIKVSAKQNTDHAPVRDAALARHKAVKDKKVSQDTDIATVATAKVSIKDKIKARVKEIASRDDVAVKDDAPIKLLKKVADFLAKAESEGKIDLPPELTQKLQEFLAKGDDIKATDVAEFMRDFSDTFKTMIVSMNNASKQGDDALQWPQELSDELKEFGLGNFIKDGKALTVYDVARLVKALVNKSENAAVETLNEKAQNALIPQDRADILVNAAASNNAAPVVAPETKKQVQEAPKAAEVAAAPVDAALAADPALEVLVGAGQQANAEQSAKAQKGKAPAGDLTAINNQQKEAVTPHTTLLNAMAAATGHVAKSGEAVNFESNNAISANLGVNGVNNLNAADGLNKATANIQNVKFSAVLQQAAQHSAANPATQQVVVQLQQRGNKSGQISLQLSPAELGRVDVRVTIQRDGTAHAVIAADKPETLTLLQKDASHLEKALQQAGINANSENMSFNLREQRQPQQFDQNRKRFSRSDIDDGAIKEVALSGIMTEAVISDDRVNYHA